MQNATDEQLLDAYFKGEREAFNVFFARHYGRVVGYARKIGIPENEALDVAQEVFTKLHRNIRYYDPTKPAMPWFFVLVKNCARDWMRHRGRSQGKEDLFDDAGRLAEMPAQQRAEAHSADDEMLKNLSQLTTAQKDVLEDRIVHDLSFKEIAANRGGSEESLRKLYQRAVASLRKIAGGKK